MKIQSWKGWLVMALLTGIVWGETADKSFREPPEKYWNFAELAQVPAYRESPYADSRAAGLRDILVSGAETDGERPEFFAYIGMPEGAVPAGGFPGIVLIHGGGGTAFPQYVRLWVERGYAVIALDWYYRRPLPNPGELTETSVGKVALASGKSGHIVNVANMVLAHSLLRSLESVNPEKTAFVGLSWGSWYGAMLAAVDPRFKGGILIYCGGLERAKTPFINGRFHHAAKIPLCWVAGTNDQNVTPASLQAGFDECPRVANTSLVIRLPHSHVGFTFDSCFRMAEYFLRDGVGLPRLERAVVNGKEISAAIAAKGQGISRAILCYTEDAAEPVSHKRVWKSVPAQVDAERVWCELPERVYQCFLSAYDEDSRFNDLCGSSNIVTWPSGEPAGAQP